VKLANDASASEIEEAALAVCKFAESMSGSPGVAATLLTVAVVLYAENQDEDIAALEGQIAFLARRLESWRGDRG
jgi:hypothetical protein